MRAELRRAVRERANGHCEYCRLPADFSPASFEVEHILPRAGGGGDALENLALSCPGCNAHKAASVTARDPQRGEEVPLFHPRRDDWNTHFAWSENYEQIVGLTATERATIVRLQMNRPEVANLRRALWRVEAHPQQTFS